MRRVTCCIVVGLAASMALGGKADLTREAPLPREWYAPHRLLPVLAERDGLQWAMPERLTGNALVGGEKVSAKTALDEACRGWGLSWEEANGVIVVHRADDAALERRTAALEAGGKRGVEAAWELGWLGDGRALPALAKALTGQDVSVALAAARAVEILDKRIPLGRTHRVDPILGGRVSLAAAFPPKGDVAALLDSPYPPLRAAAVRLMLGQGGAAAETAKAKTAGDRSVLVQQVRQQMLFASTKWEVSRADGTKPLPPAPGTPEEIEAACRKIIDEILPLEKRSEWAQMRWRARVIAAWSRAGHEEAADGLIELSRTKAQRFWYPAYVLKHMTETGGEKVEARLREAFAKGDRATIARGLEKTRSGPALLSFTKPYLREQTICYVTARKAGRAASDDLLAAAEKSGKGFYSAVDALGAVGGPRAVGALEVLLAKEEPHSGTLAFRSAKALGQAGGAEALEALLKASRDADRFRRHAATLFLGRIGGPKAEARLTEVLEAETDRLIRAAAADALDQIGTETALASTDAFRKADASVPSLAYRPRNKRLGEDFPINVWVNLEVRIRAFAAFGEMGWNYDAANGLFFRYGGCSGYTNELTVFDLGTEKFVQRRPNEEIAGWDDRRPPRGCSAGRCWDPYVKAAWIGPAIGGSAHDVAIAEYYNKGGGYSLSSYDLAADRFRSAAKAVNCGRYVYDWKNGLMMPVTFTHRNYKTKDWWVFNTRREDPYDLKAWLDKTNPAGDYPFASSARYTIAAVDQESGLMVVFVPPHTDRYLKKEMPGETWTYNPASNVWKNVSPEVQPQPRVWGGGFVYDPFNKVLIYQGGKKVSQYGGPNDSMTWTYNVKTNTWTDLSPGVGPGNPWVGAMAFDPEHNAAVLFDFRNKTVWAYRLKSVPTGTEVRLGRRTAGSE